MLETLLQPNDVDERCGLILKDGTIVEIENVAAVPDKSYKMNPVEVIKHADNIAATWHTHPDSDPNLSGADYTGFLGWPGLEHFIIGRRNGKVTVTKWIVENGLVLACD